ncbi:interleukin-1 receptor-associated kinase 4 [Parambassis ranga]|uniref:Interleukin-1 receptor-associated kinase 4 n=1 Tax=Parambassis ranga TaxID=210632 RepID=A0A6P7KEI9_9TELE|nr:interleukin-1 receptor-associated kinase 4 [Parambassis ranga]
MDHSVTSATYIRNLGLRLRRKLCDFLDPYDRWKDVVGSIRKPSGEPMFNQHHVRRYQGMLLQGRSPTEELLNDWGTTNSTVGDLVDILKSHKLLAAASLLLPVEDAAVTVLVPARENNNSTLPTRLVGERETQHNAPTRLLGESGTPDSSAQQPVEDTEPEDTGFSSFLYSDLMRITGNFDDRSMSEGGSRLGEGGFGTVYKGLLNNTPVAVKKLNPIEDFPMDKLQDQFNQEIQTLKMLKHENLVDMVGFSCDAEHLCLVYSFMANGSLQDRLACLDDSAPLSWKRRCLIAEGAARGLEHLHCNHHIHRDVKSANILLDENLVAKISDFGLTRASAKRTSATMMTERIVGTRAYMAPEALRGEITPKSDVFSFGVVLLEILSGLLPADDSREPQFLMEIVYDIDDEDEELTLEAFMDKKMRDWELSQAECIYTLACNCLHDRKNRRPLMKQVLLEIHGVVKSISLT